MRHPLLKALSRAQADARNEEVTDLSVLLFDQAKTADSVVPPQSWAYTSGMQYRYDANKARKLLEEAGYKNERIVFKYSSGNSYVNQYSQVIQSSLADVGMNVQIETREVNTVRTQLAQGRDAHLDAPLQVKLKRGKR